MKNEINKMLMEKAAEMTIMDAIEKGKTQAEITAYMQSDTFADSVMRYFRLLETLLPTV